MANPFSLYFFALVIYIIIDGRKLIRKIDIVFLIVSVVAAFILIGLLVYHSWDVFVSLMNTSYPGARVETGGEVPFTQPLFYFLTLFNPFDEKILTNIVCDTVYFSVFPMGIILSIVSMIKKRQFETIYIYTIDNGRVFSFIVLCRRFPSCFSENYIIKLLSKYTSNGADRSY